jgi:hypothetical protein
MEEDWIEIPDFPAYLVSNLGNVMNAHHRRAVMPTNNQYGILRVGLWRNGKTQTRALATLVADAFVPRPDPKYDTPIHLNGNRRDCRAENLVWRPRWFAIKYHKQFGTPRFELTDIPVKDVGTDQFYPTIRDACVAHGLLWGDVVRSYISDKPTFPTGQQFEA